MATEGEFVIYVQSVVNKKEYPNNRAASFTNILNPPINLDEEFEVALQNLIFLKKFDAILAYDERFNIDMEFIFLDKDNKIVNKKTYNYVPDLNISGNSVMETVVDLDLNIKNFLARNELLGDSHGDPILKFDYMTQSVRIFKPKVPSYVQLYKDQRIKWKFSPPLANMLGVNSRYNNTFRPIFNRPPVIKTPDVLFIYSDIVSQTNFSNQNVSILDLVPVGNIFAKTTVSPMYKPLHTSSFDTISMMIYDEEGKEASFNSDVNIIAVLHFKPKK